jgi:hypothetical protein
MMGGQACVLYGAAEFSRDLDLALLIEPENLRRLNELLDELDAPSVAVPSFEIQYLERGHAIHFRCRHPDVRGLRIDIMSKLRGVDDFPALWRRRTVLQTEDGVELNVLSLADLVRAKKTQRDKDWPMIRRLVEAHYFQNRLLPGEGHVQFWLLELRTPELLMELAERNPALTKDLAVTRPLLRFGLSGDLAGLMAAVDEEERLEREQDRSYWEPLKLELAELRRRR